MTRAQISRSLTLGVAAFTTAFFGFASAASAQIGSILTTGPGSNNHVSENVNRNCMINNNNNLSANTTNHQTATTGHATVSNNTNAGGWGAGWGAYNPAAWQAQGHTYAEWQSAVTAYVSSMQAQWGSNGGGGAWTGDASNNANTNVQFMVNNSGANCDHDHYGGGYGGGSIGNTGPNSNNQINGNYTSNSQQNNNNNLSAQANNNQSASSGHAWVNGNTNAWGGSGTGGAYNNAGTSVWGSVNNGGYGGGGNYPGSSYGGAGGGGYGSGSGGYGSSISNTGPYSNNYVNRYYTSNYSVNNSNTFQASTTNNQYSSSGSATVTNNTNAGGAGTGSAGNTAATNYSFSASN